MTPRTMQAAAQWHQQNYGHSYSQRLHEQQGHQPQAHQQPYGYGGGGGNQAFHGFVEDGSIHSGSGGSGGGRSNRGGGGRNSKTPPPRRRSDAIGVQCKEHYDTCEQYLHSFFLLEYAGPQDSGPHMMSGGLGPASGGDNRAFQSSGGNRAFQRPSEDRRTHDNGGGFAVGRSNGGGGGGGRNSKSLEPPTR
ncbi:hypothetical protein LTR12_000684 [Friedmanniomyces endolithicus]|nr:hypothetical protein LTR12_000684 [Friedmanniomyces endolithicus]